LRGGAFLAGLHFLIGDRRGCPDAGKRSVIQPDRLPAPARRRADRGQRGGELDDEAPGESGSA